MKKISDVYYKKLALAIEILHMTMVGDLNPKNKCHDHEGLR